MTLPACFKCNNGFSFDESVVRTFLALVSEHPDFVTERQPDGRLARSFERNRRLKVAIDESRQPDGSLGWTPTVTSSFERVFRKTVQGLFYGLYEQLVPASKVELLSVEDQRTISPDEVANRLRPPPLRDITDEPLSEISPSSWHFREPIFVMKLQPESGGPEVDRIFRLVRDTPIEWMPFQPGIFSYAFVGREGEKSACIIDLWKTLVISISAPWPGGRGPFRKGRNNPMSRD